jgi:tRNA(Arg) A34 adenosine deaminase TadA
MPDGARETFMQQAIDLALEGVRTNQGGPFGAVLVREGRVVGAGCNRVTSTNDPTAHAEIVAIRAACAGLATFALADCELFATCEPCPMCWAAIHWARVPRVFYACRRDDAASAGFDDAALYEELVHPPRAPRVAFQALMREQGLAVFRAWLEKPDRKRY